MPFFVKIVAYPFLGLSLDLSVRGGNLRTVLSVLGFQFLCPLHSTYHVSRGYKISANRRAVSLSELASFQYTTTTNYTNDRALF